MTLNIILAVLKSKIKDVTKYYVYFDYNSESKDAVHTYNLSVDDDGVDISHNSHTKIKGDQYMISGESCTLNPVDPLLKDQLRGCISHRNKKAVRKCLNYMMRTGFTYGGDEVAVTSTYTDYKFNE